METIGQSTAKETLRTLLSDKGLDDKQVKQLFSSVVSEDELIHRLNRADSAGEFSDLFSDKEHEALADILFGPEAEM